MSNEAALAKPHADRRRKAVALGIGILLAIILIGVIAVFRPYRGAPTWLEWDSSSWSFDRGSYVVLDSGNETTYDYWNLGPLEVNQFVKITPLKP